MINSMRLVGEFAGPFAATVAAIASVFASFRSHQNANDIKQVKIEINSRLSELLSLTRDAAHAQGVLEEKTRQEFGKIDNSEFGKPPTGKP